MSDMSNQDLIIHTLLYNQPYFRELLRPVMVQRDELKLKEKPEFHADIDKQFNEIARIELMKDMTARHGIAVDEIKMVLETLNLKDYLK